MPVVVVGCVLAHVVVVVLVVVVIVVIGVVAHVVVVVVGAHVVVVVDGTAAVVVVVVVHWVVTRDGDAMQKYTKTFIILTACNANFDGLFFHQICNSKLCLLLLLCFFFLHLLQHTIFEKKELYESCFGVLTLKQQLAVKRVRKRHV